MAMELMDILERIMVPNRDNKEEFTEPGRLEVITTLLWQSRYRRVNPQGLFHLYAARPLSEMAREKIVLVSSHVDVVPEMVSCFTRREQDGLIRGTYDNAITNACLVKVMLEGNLPDNVLLAFTGDEERGCRGAKRSLKYLREKGLEPSCCIALDVTEENWGGTFTVENLFIKEELERVLYDFLAPQEGFCIVPSEDARYLRQLSCFPQGFEDAGEDEAVAYAKKGAQSFSLCLPIQGVMHSSIGVLAVEKGVEDYTSVLERLLLLLAR